MIRANITFRPHDRRDGQFGVEARIAGRDKWMEVSRGSGAQLVVFNTAAARDAELDRMRVRERARRKFNTKGRRT